MKPFGKKAVSNLAITQLGMNNEDQTSSKTTNILIFAVKNPPVTLDRFASLFKRLCRRFSACFKRSFSSMEESSYSSLKRT